MAEQLLKTVDGASCVSSKVICEAFGVSRETLSSWVNKKEAPKACTGWYPLRDFIKWYIDMKVQPKNDDVENMTSTQRKTYYESLLKAEQARSAEFKNAIQEGEYIAKDEVVTELQRFFMSLKRTMEGYSRKIAMEVSPYVSPESVREIEKNITEVTRKVLKEMSVRGVYSAKD